MAIRPANTTDRPAYTTGATPTNTSYVDSTKFIPELYSKKVLRNFYEGTFYHEIMNTDYEGEIKGQGSKVWIRRTPVISTNPYSVGTDIDYEVPSVDATSLEITEGVYSAFQIDDINKVQSDLNLISMFAKDAANRIKIDVDQDCMTYMATRAAATNMGATAGAISASINLGVITGAGASVDISSTTAIEKIVEINQVLDETNQPSEGRWLVLPAWYCALLKLGDLRRADVTGDATGVIRNGLIGMVDRTVIYQSNNLYTATDGDTETSTYVLAGTKEAASFASQLDKVDTLKIQNSFGEYWRTLFVYGRAVVQPDALVSMICKKA